MSRYFRPIFSLTECLSAVLGHFFQTDCVACDLPTKGTTFCGSCDLFIPAEQHTLRVECGKLQRIRSAFYLTSSAKEVIHRIKYGSWPELIHELTKKISKEHLEDFSGFDGVIPVPLHSSRWMARGFNQSEVLARAISDICGKRLFVEGLTKRKPTSPQSASSFRERRRNLSQAFVWNSRVAIPERILLVDDVYTTGATIDECAKTLVRAGAESVQAWTLYRAMPDWN